MNGNIWVVAEQWKGQISEITYEVMALGRELADGLGARLEAVLLGHNARSLAAGLGKADLVLYADHESLAEPNIEALMSALVQLMRERKPRAVLVPLTNVSMGLSTLVAAELELPVVNFCKDAKVVDGAVQATCVLYGGKIEATVATAGDSAILAVWPGARQADQGRSGASPAVEEVALELPAGLCIKLKRYLEPEMGEVDITQQQVLVAVGRGIQSKDNLEMAEELAEALGGAVCGSRPVIDQGWLPLSRQVGKSGMQVKPRLYLALGISGAPEHLEGMRGSDLIVAVNTDPAAPIFNEAHYGVVADALDLMPALAEKVKAAKG
ncbi:MAG: electron transfer flavoprotein subunit alpha/FixB family protein [Bryobacterales bacterium]|nr:electron transfer flavoprotein subunit alpha/FixB family protein [Bryobacterales bacterium]